MTAFVNLDDSVMSRGTSAARPGPQHFVVDEAYWGYVVRQADEDPLSVRILMGLAWGAGIVFAVGALGLWLMPQSVISADLIGMKMGASVLMAGFAAFFLWYASRGTRTELQVDTSLGEVREVVRNQTGKPSLVGRYGFDAIGGVYLERAAGGPGDTCLVLRHGNGGQLLPVAWGHESQLVALRDRMGHDMMVRPQNTLRQPFAVEQSGAQAILT
ncbi:MAG: hypothetical protein GW886_00800 [Rhodobacterales bacterium]|nr:hypothetical protein [Rhodobacterales bacterium]NCT11996.1 hypothetical protein [Rhodobacterales bacterium]